MSVYGGPDIITDGLVLHLDAANRKSFPPGGTSIYWYDLSGNDHDAVAGSRGAIPTADSGPTGGFTFDGADDYMSVGGISGDFSNLTVMVWFNPGSITNHENVLDCNYSYNGVTGNIGPRLEMSSVGALRWIFSASTTNNSSFNGPYAVTAGNFNQSPNANKWHFTAFTWDGTYGRTYYNDSGPVQTTSSTSWVEEITNVVIGKGFHLGGTERAFTGKVANIQIYNTTLSADEIRQNYNALKGRYGLT